MCGQESISGEVGWGVGKHVQVGRGCSKDGDRCACWLGGTVTGRSLNEETGSDCEVELGMQGGPHVSGRGESPPGLQPASAIWDVRAEELKKDWQSLKSRLTEKPGAVADASPGGKE